MIIEDANSYVIKQCIDCPNKSTCTNISSCYVQKSAINAYNAGEKNIILKIKDLLCKQDEDYDKPILSPKFLSDYLDQIRMD